MTDKPKISINKDLGGLGGWLVGGCSRVFLCLVRGTIVRSDTIL
jgi:hypothetical protein